MSARMTDSDTPAFDSATISLTLTADAAAGLRTSTRSRIARTVERATPTLQAAAPRSPTESLLKIGPIVGQSALASGHIHANWTVIPQRSSGKLTFYAGL